MQILQDTLFDMPLHLLAQQELMVTEVTVQALDYCTDSMVYQFIVGSFIAARNSVHEFQHFMFGYPNEQDMTLQNHVSNFPVLANKFHPSISLI